MGGLGHTVAQRRATSHTVAYRRARHSMLRELHLHGITVTDELLAKVLQPLVAVGQLHTLALDRCVAGTVGAVEQ